MTTPDLLSVEDVQVQFRVRKARGFGRDRLQAVNGVSFKLRRGETLGIVGELGCGKSTLGRALLGLVPLESGQVVIDGHDVLRLSRRDRIASRRRMQAVFQDPYASLDPRMSVHDIVAEPLAINSLYEAERVALLLRAVGLDPVAVSDRRPAEFSGGQRQRIAIARALALEPDMLILDEAVSALDVSIQAQVINLLSRLQRERGLAYLFISHNLAVVRQIAHRVAVMYLGRIVEIADRDVLFERPAHPYTRALLAAVPIPDPRRRQARRQAVLAGDPPNPLVPPSGCAFRTRCPIAREQCAIAPPLVAVAEAAHAAACHFAGKVATTVG